MFQAAVLSRTAYYYQPVRGGDTQLIDALLALVSKHPRWGFPKCRKRLQALGYQWNHKRIYRVYLVAPEEYPIKHRVFSESELFTNLK